MKQTIRLMFLLIVLAVANSDVFAQSKPVFAPDVPFVYLGVDFTEVRVINDASATPSDIKNRHFAGINQLIITEGKKYDWQKALGKTNLTNDISLVTAKNEKVDESKISSTTTADETRLKKADIERMLGQYDFAGKKGIGLILFMESMSKPSENGSMWVTFVDMDNKKLVLTERMVGKAGGFGFRNYYAATIYKVIQEIKKNKIDEWRGK